MHDQQTAQNQSITYITVPDEMQPITKYLAVGNNAEFIDQLVVKSKQPHVAQNTPNDQATRFSDTAAFQEWKSKGRQVYWLLGPDHDLAGIIWYGKKQYPYAASTLSKASEVPEYSFAIRLYEGYVGHRLARPFMTLSIKALVRDRRDSGEAMPGIWLQTDIANDAAVAAYTKFGYMEVCRDGKRVTMVLPSAKALAIANV